MVNTGYPSHMSSPAYLLQVASFARTRVFTSSFVSRACKRTASRLPSFSNYNPRLTLRCLSSGDTESNFPAEPTPTEESSSTTSETPINGATPTLPPKPTPSTDDILDAFDSFIDDIEEEAEQSLSPAEKRKAEHERRLAEVKEAYARRLEILTSLPLELVIDSVKTKCPGCGTNIQSKNPDRPGYLPETVVQELAERDLVPDADPTEEEVSPLRKPKRKEVICQRCYRLTHYGTIEAHLRVNTKKVAGVAQSDAPNAGVAQPVKVSTCKELSPETFRKTLERLRSINAVIIYLVDIFDFHGSFISSLRDIIGVKNPVLLAVNKVDLLPKDYKAARVENWIRQECLSLGLKGDAGVHLISSVKGTGVRALLADALTIAKRRRCDIYVIGAANVGKSSFINQLINIRRYDGNVQKKRGEKRPPSRTPPMGAITTSVVPGTTLDVIKIPLGGNVNLFDTPGLMMPHQLTNYLAEKELKAVLPTNTVENTTFRLEEGKAIYIGGLARLEVVEGRAFFFTCFFSPTVKVHPGRVENSSEFVERHVGTLLTPPYSEEGFSRLGEWTTKTFTTTGEGWKKASVDVVFSGLGWIAVTGPGSVQLRACVPKGVGVFIREPLMPFEAQTGVSRYTGTAAVNKKKEKKATKQRKQAWE